MDGKKTNTLILAAGISSRMGKPKHTLKLRNSKTFLESLIDQYLAFGCYKIAVVLNAEGMASVDQSTFIQYPEIKLVENFSPDAGRFLSIKLGLNILGFETPVFLQNVDNPFAPREVLGNLKKNLAGFDFAKPVYQGKGGHPVLLGPKVIKRVSEQSSVDLNFKYFLEKFQGGKIKVEDACILTNINTPEDYKRFLSISKYH